MATILEQIVDQTTIDVRKRKHKTSFSDFDSFPDFERPRRSFREALSEDDSLSIIAEIKKASPSKGVIRKDFDPQKIAAQYQKGGAAAISVLTDEPAFKGSLEYLQIVSNEVELPVMRKDFLIDPYQVKEARAYGADAILLITSITEGNQLQELHHAATEFGLECLVECYTEEDVQKVDFEYVNILGANNRDLHTFKVDVHRGIALLRSAPEGTVLISESGISNARQLKLLQEKGIDAALIGEYFMRQDDPGVALKNLLEELKKLSTKDLNEFQSK